MKQFVFLLVALLILFGVLNLMTSDRGGNDGICSDPDNQNVDDQSWYEMCKDE